MFGMGFLLVLALTLSPVVFSSPPALARSPSSAFSEPRAFPFRGLHPSSQPAFPLGPSSLPAFRLAEVGFGWPVQDARVLRRFDPPPQPWLSGHRGVDLSGSPGVVVRAAGAGTIVFTGEVAGRAVVSVSHPGGLRTTYEPVVGRGLSVGDSVAAGQEIGTLTEGHPGCPGAACLHWGLRRGGDYLDPLVLLGLGRVRLLPL